MAVSKPNFASKYAFDSIFQALQDMHTFAPLQSQNFRKKSVWKISDFRENAARKLQMSRNLQNFAKFELKFQKFQLENLIKSGRFWKMLTNAYLLAKIGADTAENEQHFAEILQNFDRVIRTPNTDGSTEKAANKTFQEIAHSI